MGGTSEGVKALIMPEMDLNMASMGKMVQEMHHTIIWSHEPGHGAFWRDPDTGSRTRLVVENYVPMLLPHDDQTG
eukprot:4114257-Heterocapsa_arctica.AAC.1